MGECPGPGPSLLPPAFRELRRGEQVRDGHSEPGPWGRGWGASAEVGAGGSGAGPGGRGGRSRPRSPGVPALGGAGAAAQWQEAGLGALSAGCGRRRLPLPPAAMGTGPGVSGRRAASRPGPGMPSWASAPCWARGRSRDREGQVGRGLPCGQRGRGWGARGGRAAGRGGTARGRGTRAWGPEVCVPTPPSRGPGGGGGLPTPVFCVRGCLRTHLWVPGPARGHPSPFPSSAPACHTPPAPAPGQPRGEGKATRVPLPGRSDSILLPNRPPLYL